MACRLGFVEGRGSVVKSGGAVMALELFGLTKQGL